MVKIVRAEEGEKKESAAAWDEDENEMVVDFPRPRSPWEEYYIGGYEAYFSSQSLNISPPPPGVLSPPRIPPLWDFRPDIHISPLPPCHVTKIRSPTISRLTISEVDLVDSPFSDLFKRIVDELVDSLFSLLKRIIPNLADKPNYNLGTLLDYWTYPHPVSIILTKATRLLRKLQLRKLRRSLKTNQRIKSLGKPGRAGNTFASEDVPTHFAANFVDTACSMKRKCKQYADPQFLSPYPQKDERSLLEVKTLEDYEIVSPRVCNQTSCNTSLLPVSSASTSQISNLKGRNQQSSSRSMSELTEQSQSFVFLGNSQVSFSHETPMQHMPEFVQEDSLFCPPQSEQLTRDTVLHMNHTFPPESAIQEEVTSRGTEKIDNIRKCDSIEHQSAVEGEAMNNDEGNFGSANQTVDAIGILLKKNKGKIFRSIVLEDLRPYFGKTSREEAAKSLGVSVSTVKRVCRDHKITRWPYRKINKDEYSSPSELKGAKTGASVQSSLTTPFRGALPSKPLIQAAVQFCQSDAPSFNPPPRQLSTVTVSQTSPHERRMQDANFVTIKATHDGTNTIIKFDIPSSATMDDLEGEVAKRLKLNVGSFAIKYQDQEGDWILITGYDDLQYCIRTLRSLAIVKMLVQSTTSRPT